VPAVAVTGGGDGSSPSTPGAADEATADDAGTTVVATDDVPRRAIAGLSNGRELRNAAEASAQVDAEAAYEAQVAAAEESTESVDTTAEVTTTEAPPETATTAPPTTAAPEPPPTVATTPVVPSGVWDRLAACESGGNWAMNSGNGYYGGLQFLLSTWQINGGSAYAAYPHQASREAQIAVAERVVAASGGSYSAWGACAASLGLP
jgi:hypothetical protein